MPPLPPRLPLFPYTTLFRSDYGERHQAGLRVGTALTEGTANFLVNRRMNKSQQMRWSRRGADRLFQVRCALYNGKLGDRKSTRLNSSHPSISYAVFCLKKKI